jgi:hypothetical protein
VQERCICIVPLEAFPLTVGKREWSGVGCRSPYLTSSSLNILPYLNKASKTVASFGCGFFYFVFTDEKAG